MYANEWLAGHHDEEHRRFLRLLTASFVAHLVGFLLLAFAPSPAPPPLPQVLRVDLMAGLPAPPAGGAPAAKPAALPPAPAPPKPKPLPQPKQVVLPKEAPTAVPKKKVPPPPPARPEPIEYDDALAQLRNELGEKTPADAPPAEDVSDAELMATTAPGQSQGSDRGGSTVDPDLARWVIATRRHLQDNWITPPKLLNRGLSTVLEVKLNAVGDVLGTPRVARPSGDPYYDDNAVRAVMQSSPLPPPPSSGTWTFDFRE